MRRLNRKKHEGALRTNVIDKENKRTRNRLQSRSPLAVVEHVLVLVRFRCIQILRPSLTKTLTLIPSLGLTLRIHVLNHWDQQQVHLHLCIL